MHESCHFTVRSNRGDVTMIQIAEVTFYDETGDALPVSSVSTGCEPVSDESASEAVDGSAATKWLCSPFVEPWCVDVSTVSTVSRECRVCVECVSRVCRGVSVDTSVEVSRVSRVSRVSECRGF